MLSLVFDCGTGSIFSSGMSPSTVFFTSSISASLLSLSRCTVVSESFQAAFIINAFSSASFVFNHNDSSGTKIDKREIQFVAANAPS